jgi:hypothetical protein
LRKILTFAVLLLIVVVVVFRQRIFLRDPLGKVERNGVAVAGARLFINFSNDVLVEEPGTERRYLVQEWNAVPGVPRVLGCLQGLVCWTDADHAAVFSLNGREAGPRAVMGAKEVRFVDENGAAIMVQLR